MKNYEVKNVKGVSGMENQVVMDLGQLHISTSYHDDERVLLEILSNKTFQKLLVEYPHHYFMFDYTDRLGTQHKRGMEWSLLIIKIGDTFGGASFLESLGLLHQ